MKLKVTLRNKLTVLIVAVALVPFMALGFYANLVMRSALEKDAIGNMLLLRDWKAAQLEQYVGSLTTFVGEARHFRTIAEALRGFGGAMKDGPSSPDYNRVEAGFADAVRGRAAAAGASEVYLIDTAGNVVYSSMKRDDVGTNLLSGKYKGSQLAALFREARDREAAVDMAWYEPARQVAAYLGGPVTDEQGALLGVIAVQVSRDQIKRVMEVGQGLDETADVYAVGPDFLMRSDARLDSTNRSVDASFKNPTLGKVDTPSVREALSGKSDTSTSTNYSGARVLAAYRPVEFLGIKWALVAEVSHSAAIMAATHFQMLGMGLGAVGFLFLIGVAFLLARSIGGPIQATLASLGSTATQIAATVDEHERTAAQQAAAVNQTSSTMTEIGSSARQAAEQAEGAADAAARALTAASNGQQTVAESLAEMSNLREKVQAIAQQILRLSEQTSQIESITRLVSNLANQTNLLALNAAVEAARAGEHGKGFAVVATEIRKLADESKRSTERISALVSDIQNATNSTVMATEEGTKMVEQAGVLAQKAAAGFGAIIDTTSSASTNAQQISLNVKQQAAAVAQVVEAMSSLNEGSRETVAGLTQTRAGIRSLNDAAQHLTGLV